MAVGWELGVQKGGSGSVGVAAAAGSLMLGLLAGATKPAVQQPTLVNADSPLACMQSCDSQARKFTGLET